MSAIWGEVLHPSGAVQHVRMPVAVVTLTPEQTQLGLGA